MTGDPIVYSIGGVLVSKKCFDSIAPKDQKVLRQTTRKYFRQIVLKTREKNKKALDVLKTKKGIVVVEPDKSQYAEFEKKGHGVAEVLVDELYPREILDLSQKYREEFRAREGKEKGKAE
jgi:TRAP-type C4-dicarboxylate transport system substrate-binding protein